MSNKIIQIYSETHNNKVYKIIKIFFLKIKIRNRIAELNQSQANYASEIIDKLDAINKRLNIIQNTQRVCIQHQKIFPKYKNINQGKDVVLIASGPSLKDFKPIKKAIYVAVNKAYQYDKVKFKYLFLQDYSGATKEYIEDLCKYDAIKFLGCITDYAKVIAEHIIPEKYSNYPNIERYYVADPTDKDNFTFDIASQILGDSYSVVFPAMQFILWTNPKRIYLVGCDCNTAGYHNSNDKNYLDVDKVIDGWKRMKDFANTYYPDTKIICINPVNLKGIFIDEYTN